MVEDESKHDGEKLSDLAGQAPDTTIEPPAVDFTQGTRCQSAAQPEVKDDSFHLDRHLTYTTQRRIGIQGYGRMPDLPAKKPLADTGCWRHT